MTDPYSRRGVAATFKLPPLAATLLAGVATLGLSAPAWGQLQVDIGEHHVFGNTANQQVELFVTGGAAVSAFDLQLQLGDGTGTTPAITDVDLETGTIFANNNTGQSQAQSTEQQQFWSIVTQTGSVPANARLATITFSTVNVSEGTFDLTMTDVAGEDSAFFVTLDTTGDGHPDTVEPVPANFIDGLLVVSGSPPPPSTFKDTVDEIAAPPHVREVAAALDAFAGDAPGDSFVQQVNALLDEFASLPDAERAAAVTKLAQDILPRGYEAAMPVTANNARRVNAILTRHFADRRHGRRSPVVQAPGPGALASAPHNPGSITDTLAQNAADRHAAGRFALDGAGEDIEPHPWRVLAQVIDITEQQSHRDSIQGYRADALGAVFGADYAFTDNLDVGMAFSYLRTDTRLKGNRGSQDVDSFRIGPYANYVAGPLFIDASASYGHHRFSTERHNPSTGTDTQSDHNGHDLSGFLGGGWAFVLPADLVLAPGASVQYTYLREQSARESGPGAITIDSRSSDSLRSRVGATAYRTFHVASVALIPEVAAGWERQWLSQDHKASARFVGGGESFSVRAGEPSENALFYSAGLAAQLGDQILLFVRYDGLSAGTNDARSISGGAALRF